LNIVFLIFGIKEDVYIIRWKFCCGWLVWHWIII